MIGESQIGKSWLQMKEQWFLKFFSLWWKGSEE
jgi:hypothetical protein